MNQYKSEIRKYSPNLRSYSYSNFSTSIFLVHKCLRSGKYNYHKRSDRRAVATPHIGNPIALRIIHTIHDYSNRYHLNYYYLTCY